MTSLRFENVYFEYNSKAKILRDINLSIDRPGLICIIGPNGVGKSTLVKCINRLLTPTEGNVLIDDKPISEYRTRDLATVVGYVPAFSTDDFAMSVVDTVMMGRHPYRRMGSTREDLHIVYEVLKELGITHLAMRNFDELSAGQHQKVSLARGLAQSPDILILDEPTANLDIKHQVEVTRLMRDISHEKNITTVMISHDLNVSCKYADEVIVMSSPGIIYKIGTPSEVMTPELVKYVYGMNCLIVDDNGRPHVILQEPIPEEEFRALHSTDPEITRSESDD
ncbi:ABC-type cobalamin/Fe3+-siderophores transport systems, ATPase component [Thermoplasmatales archaeon BRNA1]|nr:ABC-type cobalamin/Fe3+-siderophores transport systems, ATPase component [Thermoplasmatales archaeon BRNA1]